LDLAASPSLKKNSRVIDAVVVVVEAVAAVTDLPVAVELAAVVHKAELLVRNKHVVAGKEAAL